MRVSSIGRWSAALAVVVLLGAGAGASAQQQTLTVVDDDFESGAFSADWDKKDGTGTAVLLNPGGGAGGSNGYARVEGVGTSEGGLGVTLSDLFANPFATDFTVEFDFMLDNTTNRQFNLQVSALSATPNVGAATINLRYESGNWAVYSTAWNTLSALGGVTAGTWNHMVLSGSNWGSGTAGNAAYAIELTNHLGAITSASGLKYYQNGNPDTGGALSINFNDTYGNNPRFWLDNVRITATGASDEWIPTDPVAYSGVYPHLAVANGTTSESGIGAVVVWNDRLWYMTYPAHTTTGSPDELYSVGADLSRVTHRAYPGNTNANRYIDPSRNLLLIGSAIVDGAGNVFAMPVAAAGQLRGRLTGTGPHLTDPNKVYYMTMEEGLYEVDVTNPAAPVINTLRVDGNHGGSANLPGEHGKGFYVAQGRVFFSNNGGGGCLAEWDGAGDAALLASWRIVDNNKYNEITSRLGVSNDDPNATDPVWAIGWDSRSVLLNVRDAASGEWTRYRLPKGSYTHDQPGGWHTEWPRIRDVGLDGGDLLMNEHGLMYRFPAALSAQNVGGITPLATFHKMIVDYVGWGDQIVMAANDCSPFDYPLYGKSHSNLLFVDRDALGECGGRPVGFGGPWLRDAVSAGQPSEAFLINGFAQRTLHLSHRQAAPVEFTIEVDPDGTGSWAVHDVVTVGATGYGYAILPPGLDAEWVRVRAGSNVASATAYLHLTNPQRPANETMIASLAKAGAPAARSQGLLLTSSSATFPLQFAADVLDAGGAIVESGFYRAQLDANLALELVKVADPAAEAAVRAAAATTQDFGVDAASVYIDSGSTRYRLPKGDAAFDNPTASGPRRGRREVVTERAVMNIHGTFYELPRDNSGGIRRIRPITTHNLDIFDYVSWRGMLVLSGNLAAAAEDDHYVVSDDGKVGLWFGNVDDLWRFGAPAGVGGPWKETAVTAGAPSDPYLMFGYDRKVLELAHDGDEAVNFIIQVDVLGDATWETFGTLSVPSGQTVRYEFPEGYSAHWVRLVSDRNVTATAQFTYTPVPEPSTAALGLLGAALVGWWWRKR